MASVTIMFTDKENGVMSANYSISEEDINRVYNAFKHVFNQQVLDYEKDNAITVGEGISKLVCDLAATSVMNHIIDLTSAAEQTIALNKIKLEAKPIIAKK